MTARTLIGVLFQAAIFGWWMAKFLMAAQSSGSATREGDLGGSLPKLPVYWLNAADIEQDRPLSSLRELLGVDEALFLAASKAVQYGHMSQTIRFCPQCGGVTISIISNWQCSATIAEPCTIRVFFPALLLPYVNSSKFCWRSTHAIAMVCTP